MTRLDHRYENTMERSGSGRPGNASFGSWPGSGILQFQLNAKLLGILLPMLWPHLFGVFNQFIVSPQEITLTPEDKGILIFSHFCNYFSNV